MPREHLHLRTLKRCLGVVVSTSMDRTAVVAVPRLRLHGRTQRIVKTTTRFFAHDHHEVCGVGDKVELLPCGRALSAKKHWAVVDILQRFPQLGGEPIPQSRLRRPPPAVAVAAAAASSAAAPAEVK